jgi:tRNA-dihydrouridine synthase C
VRVPLVANGEIWNVQDALRCRELSGCTHLMLGRGMVTDPGLALAIAAQAGGNAAAQDRPAPVIAWETLLPLIAEFWHLVRTRLDRKKQAGRLKQWLNFMRHCYPQAHSAYLELRTVNDPLEIDRWITQHAMQLDAAAAGFTKRG